MVLVNIEDRYNKMLSDLYAKNSVEGILMISCLIFNNPKVRLNQSIQVDCMKKILNEKYFDSVR